MPLITHTSIPTLTRYIDNPSTRMVHRVVDSLALLGLDMADTRLTILCDGYRTRSEFRDNNPWC